MSVTETPIDVNTVIPDGIEPVEALRCWTFSNGTLSSLNGERWTAGEALSAVCRGQHVRSYSWSVVRHGMTTEEAHASADRINNAYRDARFMPGSYVYGWCQTAPETRLPDGYGWQLDAETHDAPDEQCACGIYAADTDTLVPTSGNVYGKVKLWGKVVPGERGVRAQFAYPSEFRVAAGLADEPGLKAFGVPIVIDETVKTLQSTSFVPGGLIIAAPAPYSKRWLIRSCVRVAVAVNVAACAVNIGLALAR